MPIKVNMYKVLIASPSDVGEERTAVVEIIHKWNSLHSDSRKVILIPKMWETHSAPEYNAEPQSVINNDFVDDCDLAVCVFWSRLGTPTTSFDSGTLEEIERMGAAGKSIMMYFSEKPLPYDHDSEQLSKVKDFKNKSFKNGLIQTYSTLEEFRDYFYGHLSIRAGKLQNIEEEAENNHVVVTSSDKNGKRNISASFVKGESKEEAEKAERLRRITKHLFDSNIDDDITIVGMSKIFNLKQSEVEYYIDILENKGLVDFSGSYATGQKYYRLTKEGRSLVMEKRDI